MSEPQNVHEAWVELRDVVVQELRLMEILRWMDRQLRRFPRLYAFLSR